MCSYAKVLFDIMKDSYCYILNFLLLHFEFQLLEKVSKQEFAV